MDILNDPMYSILTKAAATHQVPDYVAATVPLTKQAAAQLEDGVFADDGARHYPLTDKAHIWLAAAYLKSAADDTAKPIYDYTAGRIKQAASLYGNSADVEAVLNYQLPPDLDPATVPANWGLYTNKERLYPMFDADGVTKAASHFERYMYQHPLEERCLIAGRIMAKAAEHGLTVSTVLEKTAGYGVPIRDVLLDEIERRSRLVSDDEVKQALDSVRSVVKVASSEELTKVTTEIERIIDSIDGMTGMRQYYGQRLLSPSEAVYTMSTKQAQALADDAITLNRQTFSLTKLASLSPEVFGVLGDDFVTEIKSASGAINRDTLQALLPTLPTPDKVLLETHLINLYA